MSSTKNISIFFPLRKIVAKYASGILYGGICPIYSLGESVEKLGESLSAFANKLKTKGLFKS